MIWYGGDHGDHSPGHGHDHEDSGNDAALTTTAPTSEFDIRHDGNMNVTRQRRHGYRIYYDTAGGQGWAGPMPAHHPTRDGRRSVPGAGHKLLAILRGKARRPEDYSRRAPWLQADGVQLATA